MEEEIYYVINKIETANETIKNLGTIPDYFKEDILKAIRKLVYDAESIETETTY